MQISRSRNAIRNIAYSFINKIIVTLGPFCVRTVFIRTLGAEYLGLNSLFSSILMVLNLTELGFSSAIVFSMYKPIAENDNSTVNALLFFYKRIYRYIGCIILCIGVILIPFLPLFINGTYPTDINIVVVYIVYLINTSISYFLFAYWGALINAHQRNDLLHKVNTVISLIMYIIQIVVLLVIKNYYAYILIMPLFTIVNNIRTYIVARKNFPEFKPKGELSEEIKSNIKEKVTGLMINKICGVSRNSFDSIFISMFLGLYETAIYNNYYYIMNAVLSIMLIANNSLDSVVGNKVYSSNIDENFHDMLNMEFIYMWMNGFCSVCMLCLYQPFMKMWMGTEMLLPFTAVVLLCTYFYVSNMGNIRSIYVQATGMWWELRYRSIAETILNITLNYFLGKYLGLHGIILATLISLFGINFCYGSSIVFKNYFGQEKHKQYLKIHFRYGLTTAIVCVLTWMICETIVDNLWGFIAKLIVCIVISNILYFIFYNRSYHYKNAKMWLLPKIKNIKLVNRFIK